MSEARNEREPMLTIDGKQVRRVGISLTGSDGEERTFTATWEEVSRAIPDDKRTCGLNARGGA